MFNLGNKNFNIETNQRLVILSINYDKFYILLHDIILSEFIYTLIRHYTSHFPEDRDGKSASESNE